MKNFKTILLNNKMKNLIKKKLKIIVIIQFMKNTIKILNSMMAQKKL